MAQFHEGTNFERTKFIGPADFAKTQFSGANFTGIFTKAEFGDDANFAEAHFSGNACFKEAKFDREANFRISQFDGNADFTEAQFRDDALFEDAIFDKNLILERSRFNKFYIKFSSINNRLKHNDEVYLALVENYKQLGWLESADECYYDYRVNHVNLGFFRRFFDLIARYSYGYGLKPELPLLWSSLIILISAVIFYFSWFLAISSG